MRKGKNRFSNDTSILRKGIVCLFMFLLINIGPSLAYRLLAEKLKAFIELAFEADEETGAEDPEKLTESDKEYLHSNDSPLLVCFIIKDKNYFHPISNLFKHFPERDTPPPKSFYSLT